jgi:acetolactate synthase-1/2/3 large subunit
METSAAGARMRTVADFVVETLRHAGAEAVFGYPGQSNLDLLHAARRAGMRFVQTADERSAGFAATGYTLTSHKVGVVCVSKGPAATNLLTPLVSAMKDGVPLIVVSGNVARSCSGRNAFQEFDACGTFTAAGAVKAAHFCQSQSEVGPALARAIRTAFTAPFGPVLIDIPYDLLSHSCSEDPISVERGTLASPFDRPLPSTVVDEVTARLDAAERPLLVVGAGARHDDAAVRAFAATYDCLVVHTMGGAGVVPTGDRLYGGMLRHNGSPRAARLVGAADLVLVLGAGLDERATGERGFFATQVFTIQVDLDAGVLARNEFVDLAIHTSIRAFLASVRHVRPRRSRRRWTEESIPLSPAAVVRTSTGCLTAADVIHAAAEAIGDAIVVKDSGSHKYWLTQIASCSGPSQSVASCHFGSMGFALPAAIGASIANPTRLVLAGCGDGGLLMSMSDLVTAVREGCDNLKILVFNNAGLGSTRDYERRRHPHLPCISDFGERLPFAAYARSMGIDTVSIESREDLHRVGPLLRQPGLRLLDCAIDATEVFGPSISYHEPLARLAALDAENAAV